MVSEISKKQIFPVPCHTCINYFKMLILTVSNFKPDIMKKVLFFILALSLAITTAYGQFTKIGGGLAYNTGFHFNNERFPDHKTGNPILFLKGIYEISLPIHLSPAVNVYMPNITKFEDVGYSDKLVIMAYSADIDGHYVFNSLDRFEFYGLAGLNFLLLTRKSSYEITGQPAVTDKQSDNALGLNLGAGTYIKLRDTFDLFAELKYILSSEGQFVASAGILLNVDWMKKHEDSGY